MFSQFFELEDAAGSVRTGDGLDLESNLPAVMSTLHYYME